MKIIPRFHVECGCRPHEKSVLWVLDLTDPDTFTQKNKQCNMCGEMAHLKLTPKKAEKIVSQAVSRTSDDQ